MKKILFALPVILLVAAGCNSSQPETQQTQPAQTQQETTQKPTPTPTATNPTPTTDQGNNDKIYTNSVYGFQLSYPSDWNTREYGQKDNYFILFTNFSATAPTTPANEFEIQIRHLGSSADDQAELKNRQSQINSNITNISGIAVSHITVDGVPALRLLHADPSPTIREDNILLLKGDTLFNIAEQSTSSSEPKELFGHPTGAASAVSPEQEMQQMDTILASFKFTK